MFPLLLSLFLAFAPAQPKIQVTCDAGPPYYTCEITEDGKCTLYKGHGAGCEWFVDVKYGCHCYEWNGNRLGEILCPFGECQGGKCKACGLAEKTSPNTWSHIKELYR